MWFLSGLWHEDTEKGEKQRLLPVSSSSSSSSSLVSAGFGTTGADVERGEQELIASTESEKELAVAAPSISSSTTAIVALCLLLVSFVAFGALSMTQSIEGNTRYFEYGLKSSISHLQSMIPIGGTNSSNDSSGGVDNNIDSIDSTMEVQSTRKARCKLNREYHANSGGSKRCRGKRVELVTAANRHGKWPVGFSWTLLEEAVDLSGSRGGTSLIVESGPTYADTLNGQQECDSFVSDVCLNGDYVLYSNQDETALGEFKKQMTLKEGSSSSPVDEDVYVDLCGNGKNRVYAGEAMDFTSSSVTQLCSVDFKGPKKDKKYVVHHVSTSYEMSMDIDPITHEPLKFATNVNTHAKDNLLLKRKKNKSDKILDGAEDVEKMESKALKKLEKLVKKIKKKKIDVDDDDDDNDNDVDIDGNGSKGLSSSLKYHTST